jgi:hypothetical protein
MVPSEEFKLQSLHHQNKTTKIMHLLDRTISHNCNNTASGNYKLPCKVKSAEEALTSLTGLDARDLKWHLKSPE